MRDFSLDTSWNLPYIHAHDSSFVRRVNRNLEVRLMFACSFDRSLVLTCVAFLLIPTAHAQITSVNDATAPPTPGVGHDYIKMFGETVNPANGSVSLRIGVPMPRGRGLDVPFSVSYSSGGVHHLESAGNG